MTFPKRIPITGWKYPIKPEVPKIITFDAYNTLYSTTLPVMEQYCLVAKKYGVKADPKQLTHEFPLIFKALRKEHPNYGKDTNISPTQWWTKLITSMFKPSKSPNAMIEEILARFEGFEAYMVYPDLLELLKEIKMKYPDVVLGIISNTDPLVYTLLKNIGLYEYFENNIYLSYNLDLKKPSAEIFQYAIEDMTTKHPRLLDDMTLQELKGSCWHIGDESINDMHAAENAGWNGVLMDRTNKYGYMSESFEKLERDGDLLSVDKIDNNSKESWEISVKQRDAIQLSERTFVVSNFEVLRAILF